MSNFVGCNALSILRLYSEFNVFIFEQSGDWINIVTREEYFLLYSTYSALNQKSSPAYNGMIICVMVAINTESCFESLNV